MNTCSVYENPSDKRKQPAAQIGATGILATQQHQFQLPRPLQLADPRLRSRYMQQEELLYYDPEDLWSRNIYVIGVPHRFACGWDDIDFYFEFYDWATGPDLCVSPASCLFGSEPHRRRRYRPRESDICIEFDSHDATFEETMDSLGELASETDQKSLRDHQVNLLEVMSEHLQPELDSVRAAAEVFLGLGVAPNQIFVGFSGRRGFFLIVPRCLAYERGSYLSAQAEKDVLAFLTEVMPANVVAAMDRSIYGRFKGIRAAYCPHPATGLRRVLITIEDLFSLPIHELILPSLETYRGWAFWPDFWSNTDVPLVPKLAAHWADFAKRQYAPEKRLRDARSVGRRSAPSDQDVSTSGTKLRPPEYETWMYPCLSSIASGVLEEGHRSGRRNDLVVQLTILLSHLCDSTQDVIDEVARLFESIDHSTPHEENLSHIRSAAESARRYDYRLSRVTCAILRREGCRCTRRCPLHEPE